MKEINIDGTIYVPKDEACAVQFAHDAEGLPYVIIRTYSAGVHAGYLKNRDGKEVVLFNSRRLWKWAGAFTLSEIALNGVSKPDECRFASALPRIILTEAIEIIECTDKARKIIEGVPTYEP